MRGKEITVFIGSTILKYQLRVGIACTERCTVLIAVVREAGKEFAYHFLCDDALTPTGSPGIPVKENTKCLMNRDCCGYAVWPHRDDILLYFFNCILEGDIAHTELVCTVKRDKQVFWKIGRVRTHAVGACHGHEALTCTGRSSSTLERRWGGANGL
jgi:hypothetical protein